MGQFLIGLAVGALATGALSTLLWRRRCSAARTPPALAEEADVKEGDRRPDAINSHKEDYLPADDPVPFVCISPTAADSPTASALKARPGRLEEAARNSADAIYAKAEDRRKRARSLGVQNLIKKLVPEVTYWPSWIKNPDSRNALLRVVQGAEMVDDRIRLTIDGQSIDFAFKDHYMTAPGAERSHHANVDVFWQNRRVLGVAMAGDFKHGFETWEPFDVYAFIEGPWIELLRELAEKNEATKREEERLRREAPDKLAALKKDFDLE
jgi:hypothetical protein